MNPLDRMAGGDGTQPPQLISGAAPPDAHAGRPGVGILETSAEVLREHLDVVQRLVLAMAHDINNQLTVVVGSTELLGESAQDADSREAIAAALQAARRAAGAVVELQEAVSHDASPGSPATCHATIVIARAARGVPRLLGREMTLESRIAEALPAVPVSPRDLERAIHALAVTMREWAGGRGRVSLEAMAVPAEGVSVRMTCEGPATAARPPMPATVRSVAAGSGGRASVESRAEGVVAELVLPGTARGGAAIDPARRSVLVVEDEEGVRTLMAQALAARGLHVLAACDGEEALRLLAAAPAACSLVVLDLGLPRLSAGETWRRIREMAPELPVLLVSGDPEGAHGAGLPADLPMLGKPFTLDALSQAVLNGLR